jgi:hypothetical protein
VYDRILGTQRLETLLIEDLQGDATEMTPVD